MNSLKLVLLAATIMLAMAFTFSCSSGDDDENPSPSNGGGGLSDLPKQVYLDGVEYNGSVDIWLRPAKVSENNLSAGVIQNGKITLDLPKNIDSKYITKNHFECNDNYSFCESNVSYPPNLRTSYWINDELNTIISSKECELILADAQDEKKGIVLFLYASELGEVKGSQKLGEIAYPESAETLIYNMNLSKGWNAVYIAEECKSNNCETLMSTNSKVIKGELKWQAFCYEKKDGSDDEPLPQP
jgi:hypothetical protein